ncbi:MAG TPA: hypothetical protein VHS31_06180 [Tepidisphaeraceae bacterium]|jgi:hypothetical protein|nr:hypothetical protein [Tepidisphaeraceae bacterium]
MIHNKSQTKRNQVWQTVAAIVWIGIITAAPVSWAAVDSVYQWSVPVAPSPDQSNRPAARAFLWVPEKCQRISAVVVGEHNMLEEDILDHPTFRRAMADLNIAIVWVSPSMESRVATPSAAHRFDAMLSDLAKVSGYSELAFAPVIPIGHSAHATYPWNFAAWEPQRTLCILSIHGDAPQTPLAGFGPQRIQFPDGALDGVPGLMVMGEYEWIDARWAPATVYRTLNPKAPIAMLADVGQGHFAACDDLVDFCALFIRKCAELRLPENGNASADTPPKLKPIDPAAGWLVQRWTPRRGRTIEPAPAPSYAGDAFDAFWAADHEMAEAIQNYRIDQNGKLPQLLGYVQDGATLPISATHAMVTLKFEPAADDESFTLQPTFLDAVPSAGEGNDVPGKNNCIRWTGLPAGAALGHAVRGGPPIVSRIEGPVEPTGPNSFRLQFYRGTNFEKPIAWFAATQAGDEKYRSAVQQAVMNIPRNINGADQVITFDPIADVPANTRTLKLQATSSAGLPVRFYVRQGPATVDGDVLKLLPVPPRAKYPLSVTVVAWQWGRAGTRPIKTTESIERTFSIIAPANGSQ